MQTITIKLCQMIPPKKASIFGYITKLGMLILVRMLKHERKKGHD